MYDQAFGRLAPSAPEVFEPRRRQLSVADRVLDVLVAQIGLKGAGIVALVGQGESAGVAQHVRMGREVEAGRCAGAFDKPGKAGCGEWRTTFGREDEGRFGI